MADHVAITSSGIHGQGGAGGRQRREALAAVAEQFDAHPNQFTQWKDQLLERADQGVRRQPAVDLKALHAKIGEPTLEK